MQACPNINSPEWDDLVKRTDLHTAYSMFMKYGNGAPYVGNRERNKTISEIEKEFNLTKYSTINGTVVKKYRGFYRDSTAKLVQDIRNKYTGDYTIKRISPSEGMKGEFALKVEGFPLLKSSVNYNVPKEKMHLEMLKAEFIKNYEEANEHILPSDPDRYDYLIDSRYQQRAKTSLESLSEVYDVNVVKRENGGIRKIEVKDKNRKETDKAIAIMTLSKDSKYSGYESIAIVDVNEEFRNLGIAANMYRVLMESLPEGSIGFVSPADSRLNNKEINTIHTKLERYFTVDRQPNGDILFRKKLANQVNYRLKATEILLSDKAKQVFKKGEKNGWDLNKILTDLQIPKEQKQLILDLGITDREQIVLELASKYSYSVEINTAKTNEEKQVIQRGDNEEFTFNGFIYEYKNGEYLKDDEIIDLIEYESAKHEAFTQPNTQHYSNLTVPGGTNYTENEISTPLITPSIKGHAQFSTDQGIGWFRSDEQATGDKDVDLGTDPAWSGTRILEGENKQGSKTRRILEIQSDLFQKGRNKKDLFTNKGNIGDNLLLDKSQFEIVSFESFPAKKSNKGFGTKQFGYSEIFEDNNYYYTEIDNNEYGRIEKSKLEEKPSKENQFLQLLNKDNNWVTFFIKSIIQDSAVKGYEKVLFPKGETAAKVEGHETIADQINAINTNIDRLSDEISNRDSNIKKSLDRISDLQTKLDVFRASANTKLVDQEIHLSRSQSDKFGFEGFSNVRVENTMSRGNKFHVEELGAEYEGFYIHGYNTGVNGEKKILKISRSEANELFESLDEEYRYRFEDMQTFLNLRSQISSENARITKLNGAKEEIERLEERKRRLKSEGIEKLAPIEAFYEIKVGNILKKQGYSPKEVMDEYGNKWNEIEVIPARDLSEFSFSRSRQFPLLDRAKQGLEKKVTTDTRNKINKQKETLIKLFPNVEEVVEDYSMPFLGQISPSGKVIRINPHLMQEEAENDTLFHEFGHLFVDLLGGMDNPKVKKARAALIGSKVEQRVAERYPDLAGTEKFDKEVVVQALGSQAYEVWEKGENRSKWKEILNEILELLKNLLGLEKNVIKSLAKEMLSGETISESTYGNKVSNYIQEQRASIDKNDPSTIINAVKEISDTVTFDEDSHTYFVGNEEFIPVSGLMYTAGYGISKEEENDVIKRGQRLGTLVHKNAEAISKNIKEVIQTDTDFEMSTEAHRDLKNVLSELFGEEYTLLTEVILADPKAKVAGTADVLAIDKKGVVHIFDFKTKNIEKGFKYYDSTRFGHSQRSVNSLQLSLYRDILKRTLGIEVSSINIVPINATVAESTTSPGKNVITKISLDRYLSKKGVLTMNYNVLAADLLRKRTLEAAKAEVLEPGDLDPNSIDFKNKLLEDTSLNKYERLYQASLDTLTKALGSARTKGRNAEVQRMEGLVDDMLAAASDPKRGIAIFTQEAVNRVNSMYSLYLQRQEQIKEGKNDVWNSSILVKWYEMLSSYDDLEEVSKILLSEGSGLEDSQTTRYRKLIDDAVAKKNLLRDLYKDIGVQVLSEAFYPNITRVEKEIEESKYREWIADHKKEIKTLTRKEIQEKATKYAKDYVHENIAAIHTQTKLRFEQELLKASADIGYMARWLESVLNTPDMVTAGMVKDFVIQSEKARLEAVNMRQDLIKLLRELEAFQNYSASTPVEKLYDFMLEKDSEGKYTGHLLMKYKSSMIAQENEMLRTTKHLPSALRNAAREKWRKENGVSINWNKFNADYKKKAKELFDEGKLSQKEHEAFLTNLAIGHRYEKKLNDILNPEAADILIKWSLDNVGGYKEVDNPEFENKEWKTLEKILMNPDDPRTKFYYFIQDISAKADSYLPENSKLRGTLPAMSKSLMESIQGGMPTMEALKLHLGKEYIPHVEDVQSGQISKSNAPIFFLPTYYTRGSTYDVSKQSYDLSTLYFNFFKMASDFRHKNEIIGNMELAKMFIQNREYIVRDAKGNPIKKILDKARDRELTKSGNTSMLAAQVEDYFKMMLYGQKTADLGTIDILGLELDKNKIIEKLSSFSALNMLGLNFMQGVANVNLGEIMQVTEALAGQFITLKDMHSATAFYMSPKNLGEVLGDIGSRSPVSLINLLNEKWDILNESVGGKFSKSTRFSQLMTTNTLFFTSHMGEHFMQTRVMLAMLGKIEAKNSKGEVIGSMRDMYQVKDGKLFLDETKVDLEKSNWTEERQILFGQKVKRVLTMHGEYSELGKIALQRYALGRAALMFRKFMYPGYDKRYGDLKYGEFLEEFTEGTYRQFARFFKNVIKDLLTLKFDLVSEKYNSLLPRERANIVRALSELSFALVTSILGAVATTMAGESDDDRERWINSFLAYQSKRARSELLFFLLPTEAMKILVSPAASISTIQNITELISQLLFGPLDRYETGNWKGRLKISKKSMKLTPVLKQWYRIKDVEDSISIFDFN